MYVKPAPFQDLAARLFDICKWEGLKADLRTMLVLCELTEGDVRSALNTLQFLGQRTDVITHTDLIASAGVKDIGKDWNFICSQIFHIPTAKQKKRLDFQKRTETFGLCIYSDAR